VQHGVLRIRVIEGSISEIKIEGDDEDRFGAREVLGSLLSEHPSRISSVERKLVSLNDVPGLRVADIAIEEIGEATGKFRLTVRVTTWNIYTTLGLDNSGSHAVGPLQLYSATFFNSYLLKGDSLGLSLSTVPDATRDLRSTRLSYDVPIGTDGFRIGGSSYYGDVWPDDERRNTNTQTINRTDELRGSFAPLQSRAATINLFGAIGFVDENEKDIFGTDYNDHVRWGRIGIDFRAQDNIGGTNYGSIALRQGLNIAEATQQGDLLSSRPDASPNFSVLEASYTRYQTLTDAISVKASATGQFSSGPLLSSQMFYLGGAAFGPGYFSGDNGLAGTVELRYDQPIQSSWMKAFQVYAFVDGGETWNRGEEMQYLGSVGIGVRVKLFDEVYASLAYAAPIGESTKTEEYRAGRVLFSLSTSLKLCPDRAQLRCF
jgi:hemolysin activation/secretion protein